MQAGEWGDKSTTDLSSDFGGTHMNPRRKEDVRITYMQKSIWNKVKMCATAYHH